MINFGQVASGLFQLVALGTIVEGLVEALKWAISIDQQRARQLSLALGVVLAVLARLDLFSSIGVPLQFQAGDIDAGLLIGSALTGLAVGRGANFMHDLYQRVKSGNPPPLPPDIVVNNISTPASGE